jgi:hypothetical protein
MANVTFEITSVSGAEILEGGQGMSGGVFLGWTGTLLNIDPDLPAISARPADIDVVVSGQTYTFSPDSTNGVKNWPAGETWYDIALDDNPYYNYITYKSQNSSNQYPTSGKSFDIWSGGLWKEINFSGQSWRDIHVQDPFKLSTSKYTLVYDYTSGSPTAHCWVKGGQINFTLVE